MPRTLVLIRHGSSDWNLTGRFTGWSDIPLTERGVVQALEAGRLLAAAGERFDEVHTSVLQRTHQTAEHLLTVMGQSEIPHHMSWRLNERHYGQLQGLSKQEIFARWSEQDYRRWWRGYATPPPALDWDDARHPRFDALYGDLDPNQLPASESLSDCQRRLLPYWHEVLAPSLQAGRALLVVSHGNTLRALVMHLDGIAPDAIEQLEIPSGVPLRYRFDETMRVCERTWLRPD